MLAVFLACLAGGLVATALLAALGGLAGHSGHGLHQIHATHAAPHLPAAHGHGPVAQGHSAAPHTHTSAGTEHAGAEGAVGAVLGWSLSWLNPLVIAAGVLCFGAGGVLATLAFPAASVPVGVLADTLGPRRLLTGGSLVAGVGSLAFALAPTWEVAAVGRMLVGVGEAGYSTIAPTIIGDLFISQRRSAALAVFYIATPLGRSV